MQRIGWMPVDVHITRRNGAHCKSSPGPVRDDAAADARDWGVVVKLMHYEIL